MPIGLRGQNYKRRNELSWCWLTNLSESILFRLSSKLNSYSLKIANVLMNGFHLQHVLRFVAWFPSFSWYAELIKDYVVSYQLESTGGNMTDKTYRYHHKLASSSPICIRISFCYLRNIVYLEREHWPCYSVLERYILVLMLLKLQDVFSDAEWCWWEGLLHFWVHSSGSKLHKTCTWCYCNCKWYDLPPVIVSVSKMWYIVLPWTLW